MIQEELVSDDIVKIIKLNFVRSAFINIIKSLSVLRSIHRIVLA